MKKLILWIIGLALTSMSFSQAPESFKYQAVARDAAGNVLDNKNVVFKISILQGSAAGTIVYSESHSVSTNQFGLVSLEIGDGVVNIGSMTGIIWGLNPHFLQVELDPEGGTDFQYMGSTQLLSVPYALHAKTVENDLVDDADSDPVNEIQTLTLDGTELVLSHEGGTIDLSNSGDNWGSQIVLTDATLTGSGIIADSLSIAQQGASEGQVLKWNGTTWLPADDEQEDGDVDPANEIQVLSLEGNDLTLSNEGGTVTLGSTGDDWGSQIVLTDATLTGSGIIADSLALAQQGATEGQVLKWNGTSWIPANDDDEDEDSDPVNEIQELSKAGDEVTLSKGGGSFTDEKNDADADPANEIQELSISGNDLTLSNGGGTVVIPSSEEGDNWGTQVVETSTILTGQGTTASPLSLAQQGATSGQALKWNGSNWAPDNDATGTPIWSTDGSDAYFNTGKIGIGTIPGGDLRQFQVKTAGWQAIAAENNSTYGTIYAKNLGSGPAGDFQNRLRIKDGTEGIGKVLTSDANGLTSWQTPSNGSLWTQDEDDILYSDGEVIVGEKGAYPHNFQVHSSSASAIIAGSESNAMLDIGRKSEANYSQIAFSTNELRKFRVGMYSGEENLWISADYGMLKGVEIQRDGDVMLSHELHSENTGTANMMPFAYGYILSTGTKYSATSNVGTVTRTATGRYTVNISDLGSGYIALVTPNQGISYLTGVVSARGTTSITVAIWDTKNDAYKDGGFSFVIYKP